MKVDRNPLTSGVNPPTSESPSPIDNKMRRSWRLSEEDLPKPYRRSRSPSRELRAIKISLPHEASLHNKIK